MNVEVFTQGLLRSVTLNRHQLLDSGQVLLREGPGQRGIRGGWLIYGQLRQNKGRYQKGP